ncbi:hypothetical protein M434DRAFT_148396 [Hypoxylon sp. CO27-5]|nr:hypothetical protein M434DRAFT_148396 [Hypoxylon sp. CO27-5]
MNSFHLSPFFVPVPLFSPSIASCHSLLQPHTATHHLLARIYSPRNTEYHSLTKKREALFSIPRVPRFYYSHPKIRSAPCEQD